MAINKPTPHPSNLPPLHSSIPPTLHPSDLPDLLTNLPPGAKIELTKLPGGEIELAMTAVQKTKAQLLQERYPDLIGQGITISDAADKYEVSKKVISNWVYRTGDVDFVDQASYPRLVDEAEIALCVDIYKERKDAGGLTGFPYFDENGVYVENVKHPERSKRLRRRHRQKERA